MTSTVGHGMAAEREFFDDSAASADTVPLVVPYRARVAPMAAISLVLGVVAVCATLTGLLAPAGVVAGVLATVAGVAGLARKRRYDRTGRGLAAFGVLLGIAAAVVGVLAISGQLSWLSSRSNEVAQVHDWLVARLPWLGRWETADR